MRYTSIDFSVCHYLFIQNEKEKGNIFPDFNTHIVIGMDCIYESNSIEQWQEVKEIFQTIPKPNNEDILFKDFKKLETRLNTIEILSK